MTQRSWFNSHALARGIAAAAFAATLIGSVQSANALTRKEVLEDNENFSIMILTFAPGEKQEKLHPPPGSGQIVTLMTAGEMDVELDDGKHRVEKGPMPAGKTWWLPKPMLHKYGNLSNHPVDVIVTTFKK